jgi:polar amino acid transport system substrate-binding protein
MAKENCLDVVPLVMDPAAAVQSVISGKADVAIGSWYRTEKRAQALGQSAPTYVDSMGLYSKDGRDTIESLIGGNVGTVQGYFWVGELQKVLGPGLKLYPTPLAMAQDLQTGRLDVAITGYNAGIYIQTHSGGYKGIQIKRVKPDDRVASSLQPAQTGMLYTKGNDSLGKALDDSIAEQHKDGSILKSLTDAGFDDATADVGEPRLVK